MRKRILSAALAVLLMLTCLPLAAVADEAPEDTPQDVPQEPSGLPALEMEEHIVYIEGSSDLVNPEGSLSRAEAAKIVCSLMKEGATPDPGAQTDFPDVPAGSWFEPYVKELTGLGIFKGFPDGAFAPMKAISRAEFVQVLSRFFEPEESEMVFVDVPRDHWAFEAVSTAVAKGWTKGYGDGTFGPTRSITRAEAITMVNRVLGRSADRAKLAADGNVVRFLDLPFTHWAYFEIMEASLPHAPFADEEGKESWTSYTVPAAQRSTGPQYYDGETYYVNADGHYVQDADVGVLHFRPDGRYTTGDGELDAQLTQIFKTYFSDDKAPIDNLYTAYYYVANRYGYRANTYLKDGDAGWENAKAKEMIRNRKGNCYNYAALMTVLARKMGYQSRAYSGWFKATFQGWVYHAWCEVTDAKGSRFLCDPDLESQFCKRVGLDWKLFMVPYAQLPFQLRELGVIMK